MPSAVTFRAFTPEDIDAFDAIRLAALEAHPEAFATDAAAWRAASRAQIEAMIGSDERADRAIFGAIEGSEVVGMVGVRREARESVRHKASLWGLFVRHDRRRSRIGTGLVRTAIDAARGMEGVERIRITVVRDEPAAYALFTSLGFEAYGTEVRAHRTGDRFYDQTYMVLPLTRDA